MQARWIVTYDITCPKRLYRVARRLQNDGVRLQWSVFECWLGVTEAARLWADLSTLIDPRHDRIRAYPLTGAAEGDNLPPAYYIV
jgi:CRISPR-associated protein Cas2